MYSFKNRKSILAFLTLIMILLLSSCEGADQAEPSENARDDDDPFVVAIAWHNNQESYSFTSTLKTVEAAGGKPVVLDMVKSEDLKYDEKGNLVGAEDEHGILTSAAAKQVKLDRWRHSDAEEIMDGFDCIIFPGGSDISPTLYYKEQGWHGIEGDTDYSAERDVSDYLLMTYCLDNDIPMLCICRGMQMLSVVSGADVVQDIGKFFDRKGIKYKDLHRDPEKKDLVPHQAVVKSHDSILYDITGKDILKGVPSWHHQIVRSVKNTALKVTSYTDTQGIRVIEGVERKDKDFAIGVQFHPEVAVRKVIDKEDNAASFMDETTALSFFTRLIEEGKEEQEEEEKAA